MVSCTRGARSIRQHHLIVDGERRCRPRQLTQPRVVRGPPVDPSAIDEAASRQNLEDVVSRLHHVPLQRLATPHHIAHALLRFTRHANHRALARAIASRALTRVVLVMRALHSRFDRQVVLIRVDPGRRRRVGREDGDGHGILVDIEATVDD